MCLWPFCYKSNMGLSNKPILLTMKQRMAAHDDLHTKYNSSDATNSNQFQSLTLCLDDKMVLYLYTIVAWVLSSNLD